NKKLSEQLQQKIETILSKSIHLCYLTTLLIHEDSYHGPPESCFL
ncbi:RBBP8 isoform 13, partial [Pan troglodytes]